MILCLTIPLSFTYIMQILLSDSLKLIISEERKKEKTISQEYATCNKTVHLTY